MQIKQLRNMIDDISVYLSTEIIPSEDRREMMVMLCATESLRGECIRQIGIETEGVGAYGIYQMEILTHADLYGNYLIYKKDLMIKINHLMVRDIEVTSKIPFYDLKYNLGYQTAVALAQLERYNKPSNPIPGRHNIQAMAEYYMRVWRPGKGSVEKAMKDYVEYIRVG
jgi:hypothetical protein